MRFARSVPSLAALSVAASLAASTAFAGGVGDMTDAERAVFRDEVKAYLMENPQVIVEAMTELQSKEDEAAYQRDIDMLTANADLIYKSPADWVGGNLNGDITVVEFMDYRCGYCRKAYQEVEDLVSSDGNIRFVLKEFPILGEESMLASQFAIAVKLVGGDAAYKSAHDALINLRGDVTEETLTRLAGDLGQDPAAVMARMKTPEVMAIITANHDLATTMEINGTPTFVIDNTMVRGYVPLDGMRQIVEGQRKDG
ncbi:MAG: DsbA family protein [Paracoccaceae bacterium]